MNKINAKEILKDKFWIVESQGEKVGTISLNEDRQYMLSNTTGTRFFKNVKQLAKKFRCRNYMDINRNTSSRC